MKVASQDTTKCTDESAISNGPEHEIQYACRLQPLREEATTTTTTTTTLKTCNGSEEANSSSTDGLFHSAHGKPRFPLLYKMRREGEELVAASKPKEETIAAWKQASQQAMSLAQTNLQSLAQSLRPGESDNAAAAAAASAVRTPFGMGTLLEYRESTETYVVQLSFGGILYTKNVPETSSFLAKEAEDGRTFFFAKKNKRKAKTVLELNETFLQWEETRRQEIQQECQRWGIPYTDKTQHQCFACLLTKAKQQQQPNAVSAGTALFANAQGQPRFPRLFKLRQSGQELVAQSRHQVQDDPCLLCGTRTCAQHSSSAFRKENVSLCLDCVQNLECGEFTSESNIFDLEERTRHLQELYGRALLLLTFCKPYMETTAQQLEEQTKQHNEIAGIGGSSAGLVSGVLGVAAACVSKSVWCWCHVAGFRLVVIRLFRINLPFLQINILTVLDATQF